jgi:hypothetical protein
MWQNNIGKGESAFEHSFEDLRVLLKFWQEANNYGKFRKWGF